MTRRRDGSLGRSRRRLAVWPVLPPLAAIAAAGAAPGAAPWPLAEPGVVFAARARHLLAGALRAALPGGGDVLVPAWHHGSEVEAIVRAGLRPRFYPVLPGGRPDAGALDALADRHPVRALHVTHVLGHVHDVTPWRAWADERGILLVEDAAQAWLATTPDGSPAGASGDIGLTCFYKTIGVPDGAGLVAAGGLPAAPAPPGGAPLGGVQAAKRAMAWAAQRHALAARALAAATSARRPSGDGEHDASGPGEPPSRVSMALAGRMADRGIPAQRRANHAQLAAALGDLVLEGFAELPPGSSPFAVPVVAGGRIDHGSAGGGDAGRRRVEKDRALAALAAAGVSALDLWSLPHPALDEAGFAYERALRDGVIGLPVHQDLDAGDLDHIVDAAVRALTARPALR